MFSRKNINFPLKNRTRRSRRGRQSNIKRNIRSFKRGRNVARSVITPNQKLEVLKVTESDNYQGSSGSFFTYYIGNGLYNPGATNWNAQPAGFDQWMSFYTKYRVLSSKISIDAVNNSDTTVNGIWLVVYPSVVNTALTGNLASAMCQPYAKKAFMANIAGINKCSVSSAISCSKVFGESPFRDENFSGDFGTNPSFKFYWCINTFSVGSDQSNVEVIVTISFKVIFYARIPLSLSAPDSLIADVNSSYVIPHHKFMPNVDEMKAIK